MPHTATRELTREMQGCIDNCTECHAICVKTAAHCLELGGEHASRQHQATLLDCAQMCAASADFLLRQSELHPRVCGVCAEACGRCAEACERMGNGDTMMQQCAEICRRCEQSCQRMAA